MSAAELELLLRKLIGEQVSDLILLNAVSIVIGLALAAWFGSYLAKKGEHRAISEDVKKLSDQASAMTSAVETVKTQISQAAWVAQKQWERKRELYTDLLAALFELRTLILTTLELTEKSKTASEVQLPKIQRELGKVLEDHFPLASKQLIRARAIGEIVLNSKIVEILDEFGRALPGPGKTPEQIVAYLKLSVAVADRAHTAIVELAKKDLAI